MNKDTASLWIAPVFLPHVGCPHRCVFCNQRLIAGTVAPPSAEQVRTRLDSFFRTRKNHSGKRCQIAFYGGSFTGMPRAVQGSYLDVARGYIDGDFIDSIRISTRPDELSDEQIRFVAARGVRTIEVGVQSLSDEVLGASGRGCTGRQAVDAILGVGRMGLEVGAQIMVGLPGDTGAQSLRTVERLCELRPDFVRIYPLLVLRGTELAERMNSGRYRPMELDEAVSLCSQMLEIFEHASIPVIRIGLQNEDWMEEAGGAVLAGPLHPAFGYLVRSALFFKRIMAALPQTSALVSEVCIRIHPDDRPLLSGYKGRNLKRFQQRLGEVKIRVEEDRELPRGNGDWVVY